MNLIPIYADIINNSIPAGVTLVPGILKDDQKAND